MRTNIVLDDDLIAEARQYSKARSKREIVREALATYVAVKAEAQRMASYRERLAMIRRRLADAPVKTPAREIIRLDRERGA